MERKLRKSKHWWRVPLLLLMLLIGGSSPTLAYINNFANSSLTKVISGPSLDRPCFTVQIMFYDADSWDSFFCHNKTEGGNKGPAVYVDGHYICSPNYELAWSGDNDDDDGDGSGAECWEACNTVDKWWGDGYSKTINGITYTVKFWNPACNNNKDKTSGQRYVQMLVFISKMQANSDHTIKVKGRWKTNDDGPWWREVVFSTTSSDSRLKLPTLGTLGMGSPTAEMTGYDKMKISGNLKTAYGPTTVGTYSGATTSGLAWTDNLTSYIGPYDQGLSTFTGEVDFDERTDYWGSQSKYVEYIITDKATIESSTMPEVKLYQWYIVTAPGFVRAKEITFTTTDLWNKKIIFSWTADESGGRSKAGTWSVYRGTKLLKSGIPYDTQSYEDSSSDLAYDTNYTYKVVFVPTGSPSGTTRSELTIEKTTGLIRPKLFFSNLSATNTYDDKIIFSWSHIGIENASGSNSINLTVERSTDRQNWTTMKTIAIEDKNTTSGSYEDKQGLETFVTYYYRLRINVMGKTYESEPVTGQLEGMSKVTEFTASRGTYSSMVKLKWLVRQVGTTTTYFTLYRRPLGSADEKDWAEIHSTSGTAASYSYDDVTALPGSFNEYKVAVSMMNGQVRVPGTETTVDGFSVATGVVSGRITFGTGMGVNDAKVTLKQQSSDGTLESGMRALLFNSAGAGLKYETDTTTIRELFGGDFSVQMYLYPVYEAMAANNTNYSAFDSYNNFSIYLRTDTNKKMFQVVPWMQDFKYSGVYVPGNQWSHVTVVYKHNVDTMRVVVTMPDGTTQATSFAAQHKWVQATNIAIGNTSGMNNKANFRGYIDEVRFFTKALTDTEINRNYNHPLAGNEPGLAIYYPFDEGIASQTIAYDFSKTNGVGNGRHAVAKVPAISTDQIPSEDQLSLMNYTDVNGNYTVRGVPFSGEGTTYSIVPKKGIHEFSPTSQSRFISTSSLVHNGVDFSDVSSFPVSGKVFYTNTTYPVEGVNFYVDGIACTRGGQLVTTDEKGNYTISVPIGDHYIQAVKNGHVFMNNGRYPADPLKTDTCATFIQEVKNLTFFDETLVNFTGRVVGGDIEGSKTLGFGLSENNIGVTELVLTPLITDYSLNNVRVVDGTVVRDSTNQATLSIASATEKIASSSWRGATQTYRNNLYIHTDPQTGEFSAMVPPLQYKVSSMSVISNAGIKFGELPTIDLSNPTHEASDTLKYDDGTSELYTYNGVLKHTYHNPEPTFTVCQEGREDASFGINTYNFKDAVNKATINDIYTVDTNGAVTYNYGITGHKAPLFIQDRPYTFLIKGYEEYKNYDNDAAHPVISTVPLAGTVVTIDNALSNEQTVWLVTDKVTVDGETYDAQEGQVFNLKSNQLMLDSLGCAIYTWTAGLPNVAKPYTRTISMTYDISGHQYPWDGNGMEGIVLGDLSSGNNFVTSGPDKLVMILRDPPGTGSSAEWTTGTSTTVTKLENDTWSDSAETGFTSHLGHTEEFITGTGTVTVANTTLVASSCKIEDKDDLTTHVTEENEGEKGETIETAISIEETVATSGEPDFVGADGDVFVGQATNIIFGNARHVGFMISDNGFEIGMRNVISTGLSFGTIFNYTQSYIENTLLPNFKMMRNNMLITTTQDSINMYNPKNGVGVHSLGKAAGNFYLTTLSPNDEDFGADSTYTVIVPNGLELMPDSIRTPEDALKWAIKQDVATTDSVLWINNQIRSWEKYLALNELEKVEAYKLREKEDSSLEYQNYSFDGGASRSYTWQKDSTNTSSWEWSVSAGVLVGNRLGFEWNKTGVDWELEVTATGGRHEAKDSVNAYTTSFAYTLAEEGNDAISVDVYRYGAFSPIFRTRGGQTSNPYEGEVRTQHYKDENGNKPIIMEATMQIEVPQIDVDVSTVSDIPTGTAANYTLRLSNASEIGADVTYRLFMLDETNPYGAQLSIDGKVLTEGRLIKVPGNQTLTKALQLRQTDTSILEYTGTDDPDNDLYGKGIGIVFASDSQPEEIADTIFIKAYYVPSSSPVDLALSNTTMNTVTKTDLQLTFSGFDRNYHNLKAFRLQYKQQGEVNWTQIHEYVLDSLNVPENSELLPKSGAKVTYTLPMASFPDGNYLFRCVSAATYGLEEVYKYSDEIALVKDMQRPRPLGQPEPSDGILSAGDEISVTFNETFLRGELTKELNFLVTGVLNGATIDHETALSMQNAETTASTEANITLAGKDFSIDTWVNVQSAGTILSHGNGANKMTVGTDASGHLVVNIGGKTYTSEPDKVIPLRQWAFLTLSYQNNDTGGNINANVATANEENNLFSDLAVDKYEGVGPLAVGKSLRGAIHELLLWDEAHNITTALANRSKTKNPSTRHLIGYWKMNEGEGTQIRDYARNRHMTMPDETWYLNNVNKAVALSGSNCLTVPTADMGIFANDDYAVEFWMRSDKQTAETQLLQMGDVALWMNAAGQLQLTGKQAYNDADATILTTNSPSLTDNAWHHVALNVLRQGAAAVYVDGQRVLTTNASNVGTIASDHLLMGVRRTTITTGIDYSYDRLFKGQIDEIRIWDATLNGEKLSTNRKVRLTGKEKGLVAYYPFEFKTLDNYSQVVTLGSDSCFTGGVHKAKIATVNSLGLDVKPLNTYTDEAPALRTKPTETNVSFTYVASDTKVVINIDENPDIIEGCTLNFTVQDVRDENGNYSLPAIWSAFVNQNRLVWETDELTVEQPANSETTVTATIQNNGGTMQSWTLNGIPAWMRASVTSGDTNPLASTKVTFTVTEATPIGKYEETIYLTGIDGIETPLTIRVTVKGEEPDWAVDENAFDGSMNLVGSLEILGVLSEDSDDIVAAFIGDECRGVAHPKYDEDFDTYMVTMDIFGNSDGEDGDSGKEVTFKVYDASTGETYPMVQTSKPVTYEANNIVGDFRNPLLLSAVDVQEQMLALGKGWTWFSLFVEPDDVTIPVVFETVKDAVSIVKNQQRYLSYSNGSWTGRNFSLNNLSMYQVKMTEARTITLTGKKVNPQKMTINLSKGWNWVAYNGSKTMSITDALADMDPQDGDYVKGQKGFANFLNGKWKGSLTSLIPGQGYMIQVTGARTFRYPKATATASARMMTDFADEPEYFTPIDYRTYADNMTVIARVMQNGMPASGVEVGVFAGEECRTAAISDDEGLLFLTIPGEGRTQLLFRMTDGYSLIDCDATLEYSSNATIGTLDEPFILNALLTGINNVNDNTSGGELYDLQGRRVYRQAEGVQRSTLKKGIYIENGQKRVKK